MSLCNVFCTQITTLHIIAGCFFPQAVIKMNSSLLQLKTSEYWKNHENPYTDNTVIHKLIRFKILLKKAFG